MALNCGVATSTCCSCSLPLSNVIFFTFCGYNPPEDFELYKKGCLLTVTTRLFSLSSGLVEPRREERRLSWLEQPRGRRLMRGLRLVLEVLREPCRLLVVWRLPEFPIVFLFRSACLLQREAWMKEAAALLSLCVLACKREFRLLFIDWQAVLAYVTGLAFKRLAFYYIYCCYCF